MSASTTSASQFTPTLPPFPQGPTLSPQGPTLSPQGPTLPPKGGFPAFPSVRASKSRARLTLTLGLLLGLTMALPSQAQAPSKTSTPDTSPQPAPKQSAAKQKPAATLQAGEVSVPVASLFKEPDPKSERVTQALLGEPVRIIEQRGTWSRVWASRQYRLSEGYPGWVLSSALAPRKAERAHGHEVTVRVARASVRRAPEALAPALSGAFLSTRLHTTEKQQGNWLEVEVPGHSEAGWISRADLMDEGRVGARHAPAGRELVATALQLRNTPYLWGGLSVLGVDCSGLTTLAYRIYGLDLPRDADQQALCGVSVDKEHLQAGDLLFFGKSPKDITHVGMYWEQGRMVEASSHGGVKVSELAPRLAKFQGARRILGTRLVMPPPSP